MDKVNSRHLDIVVFEHTVDGELLYYCVKKEDFDRYAEKCADMHEVLKGISDVLEEATDDFLFQYEIILTNLEITGATAAKQVTIH